MYEVYKHTKNYEPVFLAIVDEKNNILAILLAVIQKEHKGFFGKFSSRSIIWGGPLVRDNSPDLLDKISKKYNDIIKRKAIYTQFRNLWEWSEEEKKFFQKNGFIYEDHLDIIHDLSKPVDEQIMQMHKGRRKNIRRASRREVEFEELNDVEDINKGYELVKATYKRISLPIPDYSFFLNSYKIMMDKEMVKYFAAVNNGKIIGFRGVLCYKDLIYDWYAGSSNDHSDKYPNDFLPWKVMEWGHNNGYKTFDFGGAGKPDKEYGVRDYKLKFGGKLVNWGRFKKVHKKFLMKIGKLGFKFLQRNKYER